MSESQLRRIRRRKKLARNVKKGFVGVVLAPGKLPRITSDMTNRIMNICEMVAIVFVVFLLLHMAMPEVIGMVLVVTAGAMFAGLLLMILLSDYQEKLIEYELYGFKI